jgi:hypothetical protein
MPRCWICGEKGDSGEHLIKATDVRSLFGVITQENPVLYHDDKVKNRFVGSSKSDKFKSKALICQNCNNSRTAPHDKAWQRLSDCLREYDLSRRGKLKVRLNKVFPSDIYNNALNVHLFFVKLFGCRIVEYSVPIDIAPFSESIMESKPNPFVFLIFKKAFGSKIQTAALSAIHVENTGNRVNVAGWVYTVGDLSVEILYSPRGPSNQFLKNTFHPNCRHKYVDFEDFNPDEEDS